MILAFALGPLESARRRYSWPELGVLLAFSLYSLHVTAELLVQYYDTDPIGAWIG